jgi:hypothetical protein
MNRLMWSFAGERDDLAHDEPTLTTHKGNAIADAERLSEEIH